MNENDIDAGLIKAFGVSTVDAAAVAKLTTFDLRAAMEKISETGYRICEHAVHPEAQGRTICGMCFQPVYQPER